MKKIFTCFKYIASFLLVLLFTTKVAAQSCNALYSFHQTANTLTLNFTDISTSSNIITSWSWDFGDGHTSADQNPHHNYTHDGSYNVCLTIHDDHGCSNTFCHQLIVTPVVAASCYALFGYHQTPHTLTINFSDSSSSSNTINSWLWDFGDGHTSTDQNPHHTYAHDGTYNVCLTIHDDHGCSNTFCHHVTVISASADCHSSFTYYVDAAGGTITFINTSTGTTPHTTYLWDFGDGSSSIEENPHHTYLHNDHYNVCLFITDLTTGCTSHFCHVVNYHHEGHHHHGLIALTSFINRQGEDVHLNKEQYIVNYPNPFIGSTTVQYELAFDANVKIEIYDMQGHKLTEVINQQQSEGPHTQLIKADNLKTGLYLIKVIVNDETFIKKISVTK